jgi:hypothetical protein
MPFDIKVENNIIYVAFRGRVNSEDLERLADASEKIEAENTVSPDRLIDYSLSEGIDLSTSALENYSDRRCRTPLKNHIKSAVVAPDALSYGLSRMIQTFIDNPQMTVQVFTDRDLALKWISPQ